MLLWTLILITYGNPLVWGIESPKDEHPIVLSPVKAGEEAALLIVPGAYINGKFYQPLAEAIQAASPLSLWVGLVRPFPFDLPNPVSLIPDLENTLQMMRDQGMTTSDILLAGHSLGGVILQDEAWSLDNGILAWVMLASYVAEGHLANNTLPVMHISGDLDGLTRITKILPTFRELEAMVAEEPESKFKKAVVVLRDINHMHFASGDPPSLVASDDILSPMPFEEAYDILAEHISAYLTYITGKPEEELPAAKALLQKDFDDTAEIMQPLTYLTDITEGDGNRAPWTEEGQRIISTVLDTYKDSLDITDTTFDTVSSFGNSKPKLEVVGEKAVVSTSTHIYPHSILETMGDLSASEIGVKFKSREAVMEALQPLGVEFGDMVTCKEVNEAAFSLALNASSEITKSRFEGRGGKATFHDDDEKTTGAGWLYSHLQYNLTLNDLEVTSVSLVTGIDVGLGLGGMHYCKLLPPSRALEYIMVDSLRHTQP